MTNNNSFTFIDQLSTEIILEIFDYLSSNDIIYTFFYFNERFNSILFKYERYINNIETPTSKFYFWEIILPIIGSKIQCLTITTMDFSFSLDLFPNLKTLTISSLFPINYDRLYSLLKTKQFQNLLSFKIKSNLYSASIVPRSIGVSICHDIFYYNNSLKIFECLSDLDLSNLQSIGKLKINENIHSLSLKSIQISSILPLLEYTPNLKSLNLIITSFVDHNEISTRNLSEIKLEKFSLTFDNDKEDLIMNNFSSLLIFLKQFSLSLIILSINLSSLQVNESQINGTILQQQLLESMINLKKFHFYIKLNKIPINIKNFLLTFENQFWFDHNWLIGMHGKYLYTLPFYFNKLDDFIDFDHIQSNDLKILNSPQTWYHITSIHFSEFCILNFNLIKQLKRKIPQLISMTFNSFSNSYHLNRSENEINTTLDSVTTVHFRGSFDKHVQRWLIKILPNFKNLILSYSIDFIPILYKKIERLNIHDTQFLYRWKKTTDIYFPNVKYVEIQLDHIEQSNIIKIVENFKQSKILMLCFILNSYRYYSSIEIILDQMFTKSDFMKIVENYQIVYGYNCIQLIEKNFLS